MRGFMQLPSSLSLVALSQHCQAVCLAVGDQRTIHVQSGEGDVMSAIHTPEALDAILAGCNRKGIRERALQAALRQDLAKLKEQLQPTQGPAADAVQPMADDAAGGAVNAADGQTIEVR